MMRALDPRLMSRVKAIRGMLVADSVLGLVSALLVLAQAVLLAHVAAGGFEGESVSSLLLPAIALCGVIGLRALSSWAFEVVGRRAATSVLSKLRLDLVRRQVSEPGSARGSARADAAEVAAAAVNGIDSLEATFARYIPQVFLAMTVPIAVLVLVAAMDLLSAAIMLLTLPLVPVFMWLVGRYTEQRSRERLQALNLLAGHFLDVVRGLPTLRAFNRGEVQADRIGEVSEEYRRTTMGTLRVAFLSGAVLEFAATLGVALVAVTVGVRLVDGGIGFEAALTVLVLAPELYVPLRELGVHYHASADGRAVAGRLLDLGEEREDAESIEVGRRSDLVVAPSPRENAVRLDDVHFSYPDRDVVVLDSISLELEPAECLALTGPSGIGKSTVAELLMLIERPLAGRITIGDVGLAACDPERWRSRIAWAPQSPTMFRGTIADNIRLGDPEAGDVRLAECARLAGLDELLERLPGGVETPVGEGARALSAGERQRVALARAFLRDADLLILDEPTANLDPANAERIADSIVEVAAGRSVLLITHDPGLAARADRIVRMSPPETGTTTATTAAAAAVGEEGMAR